MRRIALINQKGGVGKTTSAANLGASLAKFGRRVLLVDIDPQANLSVHFGIDVYSESASVYDLICSDISPNDVIAHTEIEGLDIIPSNIDLAGAEIELVGVVGREIVLREKLQRILEHYDYLLIDCPPSLGLLTLNALTTVTEIFIPLQTEFFALHGLSKLLETVDIVRRRINPQLEITGIIACMYDSRTNLSQEVLQNIRRYFRDKVFKTLIRKNVRLAEAPSHGKPILTYDSHATGTIDYLSLAREVLAQETPSTDEQAAQASEVSAQTEAPMHAPVIESAGLAETTAATERPEKEQQPVWHSEQTTPVAPESQEEKEIETAEVAEGTRKEGPTGIEPLPRDVFDEEHKTSHIRRMPLPPLLERRFSRKSQSKRKKTVIGNFRQRRSKR